MATVPDIKGGKTVGERTIRGKITEYSDRLGFFTIAEGTVQHIEVPRDKVQALQEPNLFKWSFDGQFLARIERSDAVSVYEHRPGEDNPLPLLAVHGSTGGKGSSIPAADVIDFVWSPRSNLISYFAPAVGDKPSMVSILRIPERTEICSRKIHSVTDGKMSWQNDGEYLCVYMSKLAGKKRSTVLMFFRVNVSQVPVEQKELASVVHSVTWEPSGDRVIIVHTPEDQRGPVFDVYSMAGGVATSVASTSGIPKPVARTAGKGKAVEAK